MKGQFFPYKDDNVTDKTPHFTYGLVGINVVIFLFSLFNFEYIVNTFGFIPTAPLLVSAFASMFLHGDILHVGINMWYLYLFGDNIECVFGRFKFLAFYLASGFFALAFHYIVNFNSSLPVIGASGAVSGILGVYLVMFPHIKIRAIGFYTLWKLPTYVIMGSWFILQLIMGLLSLTAGGAEIAFWAHIGGFLFGAMIGLIFNKWKWGNLAKKFS